MISPSNMKDRPITIIYSENGEVYQKAQLAIHSLQRQNNENEAKLSLSRPSYVRASTEQTAKGYEYQVILLHNLLVQFKFLAVVD